MSYRDLPSEREDRDHGRVPLAAFVPLTVALIGIGVILASGLGSRDGGAQSTLKAAGAPAIDQVVTGSIRDR